MKFFRIAIAERREHCFVLRANLSIGKITTSLEDRILLAVKTHRGQFWIGVPQIRHM